MNIAEQLFQAGRDLEEQEQFELAFQKYEQAAQLNNTKAMIGIARMYLSGKFRPVEHSNLAELLLNGEPVFPWSLREEKRPDSKSALEWLRKAADLEDELACVLVGRMLCEGVGCKTDVKTGMTYLEKAVVSGNKEAQNILCLYRPDGKQLTDEAYEACLTEFQRAVAAEDDKAYELYATLKSGTKRQLARLGHVLIAAKNVQRRGYEQFQFSLSDSGIPLLPVAAKRGAWTTFLRFNLDAWMEKEPLIAVSSDILSVENPGWLLRMFHRAEIAGTLTYKSPAFGWLGEEKHAVLIRLGTDASLDEEHMNQLAASFRLMQEEYCGNNLALMVEDGEKEYSFEIAGVSGNQVEVLWRYTIGGSDRIKRAFEPELISIELACSV